MTIGAEIPFRRSHFPNSTGSRIFDHERAEFQRHTHEASTVKNGLSTSYDNLVWSKGKFHKR